MEEGLLLVREKEDKKWRIIIVEEMKRVSWIAGPMVTVMLSQFLQQVVSQMMVGHLGELYLSSTALSMSISIVTGYSFLIGMASALETLSGQAYGAQQYKKIGTQTYTAMFSLALVCIPISILWININKVLVFIGQDPAIAHEAGRFSACLVPGLFAYAVLQPLIRYFQVQSLVMPMVVSSCTALCLHIPLCWALVYKTGLKNLGAAVSMSISLWLNAIFLTLYMNFSSACEATHSPLSMEIFHGIGEFFRFAIPSATMICLEWWSFELQILLSGLLPHPELETSVLSVCLTTISTLYAIPYGIGAAASTRVSNELGAGNPQRARTAACAVMIFAAANGLIVSSVLFVTRRVFGYCFSNEKEVIDYVTTMAPLVCVNVIMDSLQGVLSGIARGCGWQHIGAVVNLAAFYLIGIPISAILGFWVQMRGRGLWIGILCGSTVQSGLLAIITGCTDWEKQARNARERLLESDFKVADGANADERLLN
ncbi:hypothetical protein KSS87_021972 [Heliosperma pusillum]|nr:hypothetical protein KSS87_021972 [Heliosperma pusillum]